MFDDAYDVTVVLGDCGDDESTRCATARLEVSVQLPVPRTGRAAYLAALSALIDDPGISVGIGRGAASGIPEDQLPFLFERMVLPSSP